MTDCCENQCNGCLLHDGKINHRKDAVKIISSQRYDPDCNDNDGEYEDSFFVGVIE